MAQLEIELGQLARFWGEEASNILWGLDEEEDAYVLGYSHGIAQAAKELRSFLWDRSCREVADIVMEKTYRGRDGW